MHARFRDPTVLQMGRPTHLPARGPVSVWCMTGGVSVSEKRCTPARARVPTDTTKTGSSYESHAASPTLTAHQPYSVAHPWAAIANSPRAISKIPRNVSEIPIFYTTDFDPIEIPRDLPKFTCGSTRARSRSMAFRRMRRMRRMRVCVFQPHPFVIACIHDRFSSCAHGCACLFAKAPSSRGPTANSLASSRH